MPAVTAKRRTGDNAEARAEAVLNKKGLITLTKNFRCKSGEIDLIMDDKNTLVFVEVRYRKNALFGSALETVNAGKQKKIIAASQFFLQQHREYQHRPWRFDVVGITGEDVAWIPNAF